MVSVLEDCAVVRWLSVPRALNPAEDPSQAHTWITPASLKGFDVGWACAGGFARRKGGR